MAIYFAKVHNWDAAFLANGQEQIATVSKVWFSLFQSIGKLDVCSCRMSLTRSILAAYTSKLISTTITRRYSWNAGCIQAVECRKSESCACRRRLPSSTQSRRCLDGAVSDLLSSDLCSRLPNSRWKSGHAIIPQAGVVDILKIRHSWIRVGCACSFLVDTFEKVRRILSTIRADSDGPQRMFIYLFPSYQTWWLAVIQTLFMSVANRESLDLPDVRIA